MAEANPVVADGYTGKVEFDGRTIRVERPGLRGKLGYGGRTSVIEVSDVTKVRVFDASLLKNGVVTFFTPGHVVATEATDPNSVIFLKKQTAAIMSVVAAVRASVAGRDPELTAELKRADVELSQARKLKEPSLVFAKYDGHRVNGYTYSGQIGVRDLEGATAIFESGSDSSRPTLTRIGAGAILAGPVGAIGGALFKKNTSRGYVTIGFSNGESLIVEGPARDERELREFAAAVNTAAANAAR